MPLFTPTQRATWSIWLFGKTKIPILAYCRPKVVEIDDEHCAIRIALRRRTHNHLKSMYFGVLAIGADLAGGFIAMELIRKRKLKISLVFKDFHAEFLKRAESDVTFTCSDGTAIQAAIQETVATGERVNLPVFVTATVLEQNDVVPVAEMTLTLSVKFRGNEQIPA